MTRIERLYSFFTPKSAPPNPAPAPVLLPSVPVFTQPAIAPQPGNQLNPSYPDITTEPLPYWLADPDSLRDEGVLFGLSEAGPDEKIAEIRAYFDQQAIPTQQAIAHYGDQISELDFHIEQHENRLNELRHRSDDLRNRQPDSDNMPRTLVSLILSVVMSIGAFYLIDDVLRPAFPNRWIAVGVFLAGMFNLSARTSFFYESESQITGRRLISEVGLPLAASVFILVQALQTRGVGQAMPLFIFVFFLFLLAGKLLLSTLTTLRADLAVIQSNRRLGVDKQQQLPVWEAQIEQLSRALDGIRAQKRAAVTNLRGNEGRLARLNAQRDQLVNLFLGEFELARSLRDRLSEQQRKLMMNYK